MGRRWAASAGPGLPSGRPNVRVQRLHLAGPAGHGRPDPRRRPGSHSRGRTRRHPRQNDHRRLPPHRRAHCRRHWADAPGRPIAGRRADRRAKRCGTGRARAGYRRLRAHSPAGQIPHHPRAANQRRGDGHDRRRRERCPRPQTRQHRRGGGQRHRCGQRNRRFDPARQQLSHHRSRHRRGSGDLYQYSQGGGLHPLQFLCRSADDFHRHDAAVAGAAGGGANFVDPPDLRRSAGYCAEF